MWAMEFMLFPGHIVSITLGSFSDNFALPPTANSHSHSDRQCSATVKKLEQSLHTHLNSLVETSFSHVFLKRFFFLSLRNKWNGVRASALMLITVWFFAHKCVRSEIGRKWAKKKEEKEQKIVKSEMWKRETMTAEAIAREQKQAKCVMESMEPTKCYLDRN